MRPYSKSYSITKKTDTNKLTAQRLSLGTLLVIATIFTVLFLSGSKNAHSSSAVFPQCTSPSVEKRIVKVFNKIEKKQWQRGFDLNALTQMHEHRTVQWKDSDILRRYCNATARFSNGRKRQVYYLIESNGGFVGRTWGVTYCVSGLDPWRNNDGNCQTVR